MAYILLPVHTLSVYTICIQTYTKIVQNTFHALFIFNVSLTHKNMLFKPIRPTSCLPLSGNNYYKLPIYAKYACAWVPLLLHTSETLLSSHQHEHSPSGTRCTLTPALPSSLDSSELGTDPAVTTSCSTHATSSIIHIT